MSTTTARKYLSGICLLACFTLSSNFTVCKAEDTAIANIKKDQETIKQLEAQMLQLMAQGKQQEAAEVKAKVTVLVEKNNRAIKESFDAIKSKLDQLNKQSADESKKMLPEYQQNLAAAEAKYGKNSSEVADKLLDLGGAQFDIGDYSGGQKTMDRAMRIYDVLPQTASNKSNKAEIIDNYKLFLKSAYLKVKRDPSRTADKEQLQKKINELEQK